MATFPSGLVAGATFAWTLMGMAGGAWGQSVALSGVMGTKALLVVDGSAPKLLAPGESFKDVKVISIDSNAAVLEIAGLRQTLRVGGQPVSVGKQAPPGTGTRIVLPATSDGHFVTQGLLNSRPAQFMIDTGATAIGIGVSDAERMGLNYKNGTPVSVDTANGSARGWKIRVNSIRLNDVEIRDVDAIVTPLAMSYVLLGNSYLARFQMTRNNEQMVLEKRP